MSGDHLATKTNLQSRVGWELAANTTHFLFNSCEQERLNADSELNMCQHKLRAAEIEHNSSCKLTEDTKQLSELTDCYCSLRESRANLRSVQDARREENKQLDKCLARRDINIYSSSGGNYFDGTVYSSGRRRRHKEAAEDKEKCSCKQRELSFLEALSHCQYPTVSLLMHVNAEALSAVFGEDDVDKIAETIVGVVTETLDVLAPLKWIMMKNPSAPPLYLQKSTWQLMHDRDLAAQKRNWPLFRHLRNLAARQVRKDRLQSNQDLLDRCRGEVRQVWQLANSLTGRSTSSAPPPSLEYEGQLVQGEGKLAEVMNGFFVEKVKKIRAGIVAERQQQQQQRHRRWHQQQQQQLGPSAARFPASSSSSSSSSSTSSTSFEFRPPSEKDVLRALNGLRNTPALGEDGIPIRILKDLALVLASPLAHLARRSFESSTVPCIFKTANVIPVLKRGKSPTNPSSYRPVALLTAMSKILEALVLQQFFPHLEAGLPPEQWGFRPNRGTSSALALAQGHWARHKAAGLVIGVAAFDYSSAFDTMGAQELVSKLKSLAVGPRASLWFEDYLSGRNQPVRLGAATSGLREINLGVPQGSLLGPALFIALTSDLPTALALDKTSEGISMYADDCCLWSAHKNPDKIRSRLQELAARLADYSLSNSLSLNAGKTQVLWIGGGSSPPSITVGDMMVPPAETLQLLGLQFDRRLTLTPYLQVLAGVAGSLHALARRLLVHLPRGQQAQDVVRALPYRTNLLVVPVWTTHFLSLIFFISGGLKLLSSEIRFFTLKVVICSNIIQGYPKGSLKWVHILGRGSPL